MLMFRIRIEVGLFFKVIYVIETVFADVSCFQGLLFCPEAASLLLHNFCIYHIDAPGHEVGIPLLFTSTSSSTSFQVITAVTY